MASTLSNPTMWHILFYGTLLGTEFYQSFIAGPIAFRALPRPGFSQLQQKTFPIYFLLQAFLPLLTLLTSPFVAPSTLTALLSHPSRLHTPHLVTSLSALANYAVVGPMVTGVMRERKAQETRDGKKYYEEGEKSVEMRALNRRFAVWHGVSSLLNLAGMVATVMYAGVLGEKLADGLM